MRSLFSVKSRIRFLVAATLLAMATLALFGVASARTYRMKTHPTAADVLLRAVESARLTANQQKYRITPIAVGQAKQAQ
jgi:hypothetical protein